MATKNFWTMVLTQVIITPSLRLIGSTADFIKILERGKFPVDLYWRLALSTNHQYREIHF